MAGESHYPTRPYWEVCRILLVRILITSFPLLRLFFFEKSVDLRCSAQIEKICAMDQGYSNALII